MAEKGTEDKVVFEKTERSGQGNPLVQKKELDSFTELARRSKGMKDLATFIRDSLKKNPDRDPTSVRSGHGPHLEEFITFEDGEVKVRSLENLQKELLEAGLGTQILGVQSIGNKFQKVEAQVQGIDSEDPSSGFERPTVAEGPNVVFVPFAYDSNMVPHYFRTLQYRTGEVVVDTTRGFADQESLEKGETGDIQANLKRVLGEEGGEGLLNIKRIVFLGSVRANTTFVTSVNPLFGVEVDYDTFVQHQRVISAEEQQRMKEQFEHEGIIGSTIDMTPSQYVDYKLDSTIPRDLDADAPTDILIIGYLNRRLEATKQARSADRERTRNLVSVLKEIKGSNPRVYEKAVAKTQAIKTPKK